MMGNLPSKEGRNRSMRYEHHQFVGLTGHEHKRVERRQQKLHEQQEHMFHLHWLLNHFHISSLCGVFQFERGLAYPWIL